MLEAMVSGLQQVLQSGSLGLLMLAILVGLFFGIVPGLTGLTYMSLLVPFVYGMDPMAGFILLIGGHAVVHTGGAVPAILFGVPGTPPNAACVLDGYPMTKRGEAGRAIGAVLTASCFGGIVGAAALAALIPVVRPVILSFAPPEIFMMVMFGITLIAIVSGKNMLKGLIIGCFGLALATIGLDPQTGILRFGFGLMFLWDGFDLISVVVGLFAVAEMIELGVKGGAIAEVGVKGTAGGYSFRQVLEGIKDVFRNFWLTLRISLIGVFVGILPGLGAEAASWFCYAHAAQTSKNNENFGKGDVRGVIAAETPTTSKEGGALLPTVAFGIPGSSAMAILLGAFIVLGLVPGPEMLTKHLDLVWGLVWILVISNIIAVAVLLGMAPFVARVALLRGSLIIPLAIILAMIGSYLIHGAWESLIVLAVFGFLGYWMKKYDYERAPLALGLVLGGLAESNLTKSLDLWGAAFLSRPIVIVLLILTFFSMLIPVYQWYRAKHRQERTH